MGPAGGCCSPPNSGAVGAGPVKSCTGAGGMPTAAGGGGDAMAGAAAAACATDGASAALPFSYKHSTLLTKREVQNVELTRVG